MLAPASLDRSWTMRMLVDNVLGAFCFSLDPCIFFVRYLNAVAGWFFGWPILPHCFEAWAGGCKGWNCDSSTRHTVIVCVEGSRWDSAPWLH